MKLIIDGEREFNDPASGVIEAGLKSLKPDSTFCLENGHWFIDTYFDGVTYNLQYKNGDTFKIYEPSVGVVNYDVVHSAFQKFRTNDFSWTSDIEFVLSEWQHSPEEILLLVENEKLLKPALLSNPAELQPVPKSYSPVTSQITDLLVNQREKKMALVDCAECAKPISDKASACPHCGCPCSSGAVDSASVGVISGPNLPSRLHLGEQVSMWSSTRSIKGNVSSDDVQFGRRSSSNLTLVRYLFGLQISGSSWRDKLDIHYSQIAEVGYVSAVNRSESSKSVLGRAAVGGILLGPVGAIIGGLSGTGKNTKVINGLFIKFWEPKKSFYDVLGVESTDTLLEVFCGEVQKSIARFAHLHK